LLNILTNNILIKILSSLNFSAKGAEGIQAGNERLESGVCLPILVKSPLR